ncbi:hypothetical protein [Brevundimonas lenta]|uniref:Uncharacterized protein n=1 Tax=Brevundimonas lenta TaxID=424796 RepID=A0A7W6NPJ0_9CAUL|nr:hypothetical protein [Brevundimonas lenta]MBB4082202.1 hypothetical protein [Brevundimonas lenta]
MTNVERHDGRQGANIRRILRWGVIAGLLVLPAVAMQFTGEVNWTTLDFLFAGGVLIGAGLLYEVAASRISAPVYRTVVGLAVIALVLAVWAWAVA